MSHKSPPARNSGVFTTDLSIAGAFVVMVLVVVAIAVTGSYAHSKSDSGRNAARAECTVVCKTHDRVVVRSHQTQQEQTLFTAYSSAWSVTYNKFPPSRQWITTATQITTLTLPDNSRCSAEYRSQGTVHNNANEQRRHP
jgi:hypothetical protein